MSAFESLAAVSDSGSTKTYSDVTVLQMPNNLPFTIESFGSSANSIFIAGKVDWAMKSTPVAASASR